MFMVVINIIILKDVKKCLYNVSIQFWDPQISECDNTLCSFYTLLCHPFSPTPLGVLFACAVKG